MTSHDILELNTVPIKHYLIFLRHFQLHDVFNLDNDNRAEDTPTLIDRKVSFHTGRQSLVLVLFWSCIEILVLLQDNVFIISNFKSKYPVLQLDLR